MQSQLSYLLALAPWFSETAEYLYTDRTLILRYRIAIHLLVSPRNELLYSRWYHRHVKPMAQQ